MKLFPELVNQEFREYFRGIPKPVSALHLVLSLSNTGIGAFHGRDPRSESDLDEFR